MGVTCHNIVLTAGEDEDCSDIVDAVSKLTAEYRRFGIGLGILPSKLDEIEKQRKTATTVKDKLSQVVQARLSQPSPPTWKTFIDAATPINRALAQSMHSYINIRALPTLLQQV